MKVLDLFCCCGGVSKGIKDAIPETELYGVDIKDNHQYPYNFIQADVFSLKEDFLKSFDLIHASPPCQCYSLGTCKARNEGREYPDLLPRTRTLLEKTGKPFIIENVYGAPIRRDLVLCGEMFGLRVIRHRLFEIHGFTVLQPKHEKHKLSVKDGTAAGVFSGGNNPGFWGNREKQLEYRRQRKAISYYMCVAGNGGDSYTYRFDKWQEAMGIDWVDSRKHLTQMIPPKYAEYITRYFPH